MAQAMTLISSQTLGSAIGTVTFSSIPSTYRDLRLVVSGSLTGTAGDLYATVNSDTGANYSRVWMLWSNTPSGASASATAETLMRFGYMFSTSVNATMADWLDYAATDKHKTSISRSSNPNDTSFAWTSRWASTAAITNLAISNTGSTFAAGAIFSLYGIAG